MSIFNKPYQVTQVFKSLRFWLIPVLSAPLLLLLGNSLPNSSQSTSPSTDVAAQEFNANLSLISQQQPISPKPSNSKPDTGAQKQSPVKKKTKAKPQAKKPQYTPPAIEIRVAIARDANNLAIGSSTPARILDRNNKLVEKLPAATSLLAQPDGASIYLGSRQLPQVLWIEPSAGGAVYVGDRWYRGRLLLVSQGSTLLAVNYVDLEQYLYSVVGSEMHANAPFEALKAQAIAARSYALVHLVRPASPWYNLGATERWQVYKGINVEWNTSQQAVAQTGGQYISYQGGIVESLYAATDEIVIQAHSGRGMSQQGAYKLAAQGYNYQQILTAYYPGTGLALLELKR